MASIYFVGPYSPIMCGIATYTNSLTKECSDQKWGVITFNLEKYGAPLRVDIVSDYDHVWYGITGREKFSSLDIQNGLYKLRAKKADSVLWIQHETGIWPNLDRFTTMLSDLNIPKVLTFHTLHFQSHETPCGLRRSQYLMLKKLLPHVDAITVFSYGVYLAVISAFPQYCSKVHIMKHGVHSYPKTKRLNRKEARVKLCDFLLNESELDQNTKEVLMRNRIFTDPDAVLLGQTGFLCQHKNSEALYSVRDNLQKLVPDHRIVAIRIGTAKDKYQKTYAKQLKSGLNSPDTILLETWLPADMLPMAQRAFDLNFYWPEECTQSGVMSHVLGSGAVIAGRDLERVGEMLKDAGQIADTNIDSLTLKIREFVLNPESGEKLEKKAQVYANQYSWPNQVQRHYALSQEVSHKVPALELLSRFGERSLELMNEVPTYASMW